MKMFRKVSLLFLLSLACGYVFGQTTAVTATIVDSDGFTWTTAQVTVNFVPNASFPNLNQYTLAGHNLATYAPYTTLLNQTVTSNSSTGAIAVTLLDNTQIQPAGSSWSFSVKSNTKAAATQYNNVQLFGSTYNLSSYLSTNAVAPRFPATAGAYAYGDVELTTTPNPGGTYFNTTNLSTRQWNGTSWTNFAGGASGVTTINAISGGFTFTGAVTCVSTPTPTCAFTGGGGGGGGFNLNASEMGAYDSGMNVLTHTNHYVVPLAQTTSQINNLIALYTNGTDLEFQAGEIPVSFRNQNWTASITHNGLSFTTFKKNWDQSGVICDARVIGITFNAGSKAITTGFTAMNTWDIGKVIWAYNPTTQQTFQSQIQTITDSLHFNVATNAPWTQGSNELVWVGTDNTTQEQDAINSAAAQINIGGVGYGTPNAGLTASAGACMAHTLDPKGVSIQGAGRVQTELVAPPAEDSFATPDAFTNGGESNILVHYSDFSIVMNDAIDMTQNWSIINDSGTTAKTGVNRSAYVMTKDSNYPLAPEWALSSGNNGAGAYNGVTSTNGSNVVCGLSANLPTVGHEILYPYTSSGLIETTVTSTAGTCGSGTARTLGASIPTSSQAEFFDATNFQHTAIDFPVSRTYPFTLTLANSISPNPVTEYGVAPYGLIQIGNEQCTYYNINYGNPTVNITITGCTGTVVDHPVGSFIAPLNPFYPTKALPVVPSINAGQATPVNAEWYPGHNIGNCAFAFPQSNGSANQAQAWSNSTIEQINIFASNAYNNTCGFYFVGLPYATHFRDITIGNTEYGIVEATPPVLQHNWAAAQPTSDGTTWDGISIHAGYIFDIITGGQNNMSNFDTYSNLGSPTGFVGSAGGFFFTAGWDDQASTLSCYSQSETHNLYIEPENGSHGEQETLLEFDQCDTSNYGLHLDGGAFVALGAFGNKFIGGNFNNTGNFGSGAAPVMNWSSALTLDGTKGEGHPPVCNQFVFTSTSIFPCTFLNWGPKTRAIVQIDKTGEYQNIAYGSRSEIRPQTGETFAMGGPFFTTADAGFIHPEEYSNALEGWVWTFDSTAVVTQSYVSCAVGGASFCEARFFDDGSGMYIGPGQRIPAAKTHFYASFESTIASNTFQFTVFALCPGQSTVAGPFTVSTTNAWPTSLATTFQADADFSSYSGCRLQFHYGNGASADVIKTQFVAFAPISENFFAKQLTLDGTGQPTISNGSNGGETWQTAAPTTGCGSTYANGYVWHNTAGTSGAKTLLYVCNAATTSWVGVD